MVVSAEWRPIVEMFTDKKRQVGVGILGESLKRDVWKYDLDSESRLVYETLWGYEVYA